MHDVSVTIIPAQPGFFRLWADPVTGILGFPDPVIAWEVVIERTKPEWQDRPYMYVYMVTPTGRVDEDEYLLHPSGEVERLHDCCWRNLDEANDAAHCSKRKANNG